MNITYKSAEFWAADTDVVIAAGVLSVPIDKLVAIEVRTARLAVAEAEAELAKIEALTDADLLAWAKQQANSPLNALSWAEAALDTAQAQLRQARKEAKVLS
jgi:multidrug efflux pump subunit AcrA (membrane-fusion protein)